MNDIGSIFALARDITVTSVLMIAIWAYATDRIVTPKQLQRLLDAKDAVIKDAGDQIAYFKAESAKKDLEIVKWTQLTIEFASSVEHGAATTKKAIDLVADRVTR